MIGPDSNINIGGIVQLDLIPLDKVVTLREKNGKCVLIIEDGFTAITVYRTYKSDRVQTTISRSEAGTTYPNEIRWLLPQDRLTLWQSITPYLNQYVILIATLNNGTRKIYGIPDFPLFVTANPTPLTTPDSFNGVEIICTGTDILPGRFLYSIVEYVEPVVPSTDFTDFDNLDEWTETYTGDGQPETDVGNASCENSICTLEMFQNSHGYADATLKHMFDSPKSLSNVTIVVTELADVVWSETFSPSDNFGLIFGIIDEDDNVRYTVITSTGLKTKDVSSYTAKGLIIWMSQRDTSTPIFAKFDSFDFVEL